MNEKSKFRFDLGGTLYFLAGVSVIVAAIIVMLNLTKHRGTGAKKAFVATPVAAVVPTFVPAPVTHKPQTGATKQLVLTGEIDQEVTGVDLRDCASVRTGNDGSVMHGVSHVSRRNGELTIHYSGCAKLVWSPPSAPVPVASIEGGVK